MNSYSKRLKSLQQENETLWDDVVEVIEEMEYKITELEDEIERLKEELEEKK